MFNESYPLGILVSDIAAMEKQAQTKYALEKFIQQSQEGRTASRTPYAIERYIQQMGETKTAAEKQGDWIPSFRQQDRDWSGAVRDTALAVGGGHLLSDAVAKPLERRIPFDPIKRTQPNVPGNYSQARDAQSTAKEYLKNKGINARVNISTHTSAPGLSSMRQGNSALIPTLQGPHRIFATSANPAILMHEAGHAANANDLAKVLGRKGSTSTLAASRLLHRGIPPRGTRLPLGTLAIAAAADKDSTLGRNAWAIPLVASAPVLTEEALASIRGSLALRKAKGLAAVRRGIPGLAAALGTYAARPLGTALSAYLMNRLKPQSQPQANTQ